MYFIHGTHDNVIPQSHGLKLYEEAFGEKILSIEGGSHNDLSSFETYWSRTSDAFLNTLDIDHNGAKGVRNCKEICEKSVSQSETFAFAVT